MSESGRTNIALLSFSQACAVASAGVMTIGAPLAGSSLTAPVWATLPVASAVIGTACFTYPAGMFMKRHGRRSGLVLGVLIASVGAVVAWQAARLSSFPWLCIAMLAIGGGNAFAQFYRYAAADGLRKEQMGRPISIVMAGSIPGALLGPQLARWIPMDHVPNYGGMFLLAAGLAAVRIPALAFVRARAPTTVPQDAHHALSRAVATPLSKNARFVTALIAVCTGHVVMSAIMVAAPMAMTGAGHGFHSAVSGIQWHMLAMYAPALLTARLLRRTAAERIIVLGAFTLCLCALVAILGTGMPNFTAVLILAGVGWSLLYVSGTTLLSQSVAQDVRHRAEAIMDAIGFTGNALAAAFAGALLTGLGWVGLNALCSVLAAIVIAMTLRQSERIETAAPQA